MFSQASIAVLPFDNLSDDPAQVYFADGITEDIITALSRVRSLAVIARNSTFVYKGKAVNIQEIGRDLGVRYVLEGSVRRADDRVRILAQLIDTETGSHLWAERFDREVSDVFAAQDEVTRNIVAALHLELPAAELERVKRKDMIVMQAYDYVLRGRNISLHYSPESQKRAREMFNKAIELDPKYAQAYAFLSVAYLNDWRLAWGSWMRWSGRYNSPSVRSNSTAARLLHTRCLRRPCCGGVNSTKRMWRLNWHCNSIQTIRSMY